MTKPDPPRKASPHTIITHHSGMLWSHKIRMFSRQEENITARLICITFQVLLPNPKFNFHLIDPLVAAGLCISIKYQQDDNNNPKIFSACSHFERISRLFFFLPLHFLPFQETHFCDHMSQTGLTLLRPCANLQKWTNLGSFAPWNWLLLPPQLYHWHLRIKKVVFLQNSFLCLHISILYSYKSVSIVSKKKCHLEEYLAPSSLPRPASREEKRKSSVRRPHLSRSPPPPFFSFISA